MGKEDDASRTPPLVLDDAFGEPTVAVLHPLMQCLPISG
jgi:uncharacterized protein YcgL (UPF0745 family)